MFAITKSIDPFICKLYLFLTNIAYKSQILLVILILVKSSLCNGYKSSIANSLYLFIHGHKLKYILLINRCINLFLSSVIIDDCPSSNQTNSNNKSAAQDER